MEGEINKQANSQSNNQENKNEILLRIYDEEEEEIVSINEANIELDILIYQLYQNENIILDKQKPDEVIK